MSKLLRHFEILLPRRFNDQRVVPDELLAETVMELERRFGSVTSETQVIRGIWQYEGQSFRDELMRVIVDVDDTPENRRFVEEFKEVLRLAFSKSTFG